MTVQSLSNTNDTRIITGGNLSIALDGLGGIDTLDLGTQGQGYFSITKSADGAVHVDTMSGASEFFHATLFNFERLHFGDGTTIDLTTFFGPATPPPVTATLATAAQGTQAGNVSYTLAFSESVTGLDASDFSVSNGAVVAVAGSGANYTVTVAPNANVEGVLQLTLAAASVNGGAGGTLAAATPGPGVLVDTKAPSLVSVTPANAAAGVAVGADVVMVFSEPIQKGSGSIVLKDASGAILATYDVATSPLVSLIGGTGLVISPSLSAGSSYTLEVSAGSVKDASGNSLNNALSIGFATSGLKAQIVGTVGNDTLTGTAANNVFEGGGGNDSIDGAGGTDTAIYRGKLSDYLLTLGASADAATTVKDNRVVTAPSGIQGEGTDSLSHVERLQFADQSLALDLGSTQAAGKAVLMMASLLGPGFVQSKSYAGLFLGFFDSGALLLDGANLLVGAGIVSAFAGGADNATFVKFIYGNVNGAPPDAATLASLVAPLDNHSTTQAQWMADMAASLANQQHVNLVGLAQTGWAFVA
jgi:Ca2+-binding RTX toxin-like protein